MTPSSNLWRVSRRKFLKFLSAIGVTGVVGAWGLSRTKLMWQVNEWMALAALGGKAEQANTLPFSGTERAVAFGDHPQQYALVFSPVATAPRRRSWVFFVHGGGWNMGNPDQYRFIGRFFAAQGFPTILAGYRLTPEYQFPTQLEDTVASLRARMDALISTMPAQRTILGGHSAGAQLASLVAYDRQGTHMEASLFSGLFSMSGPLNVAFCQSGQTRRLLDDYVAHLPDPAIADPITFADPRIPLSVLCLHGENDPVVDPENSRSFVHKLNQGSIQRARLHILAHAYHSDLLNMFFEPSEHTHLLTDWLNNIDGQPPAA